MLHFLPNHLSSFSLIAVDIGLLTSFFGFPIKNYGEIPERPKGTDCKSVGSAFAGSNPVLPTINQP